MPRKVRQLIADLMRFGFKDRGGKGSHRNFIHDQYPYSVVISGKLGDDALPYQEKAVKRAIKGVRK